MKIRLVAATLTDGQTWRS